MILKTLAVADRTVESYWKGMRPGYCGEGVSTQAHVEGPTDEPILPPIGEASHDRLDPADYRIALVAQERPSSSVLTARPSTISRVFLLPLTWQELLHKVRGELIPAELRDQAMILRFGKVKMNFLTMQVSKSEKAVALTALQFKLLRFLTRSPERVFSRDELLNEVWGYKNYPSTRTVDTHICSLRQKLEPDPARPVHFLTVCRMGYKFVP
jgi:DNA-binding response OmpR family regulator